MPRQHPDDMRDDELVPLCMTGSLDESERVESALDAGGIEYTFEITPYYGGLFGGVREGVMFLVRAEEEARCRGIIEAAGIGGLLVTED